jgi:hypothetical protein
MSVYLMSPGGDTWKIVMTRHPPANTPSPLSYLSPPSEMSLELPRDWQGFGSNEKGPALGKPAAVCFSVMLSALPGDAVVPAQSGCAPVPCQALGNSHGKEGGACF